jgi:hypothetical protein
MSSSRSSGVGQRRAVLVARADEHRQDVVAVGDARVGAALADERVERPVDPVAQPRHRAPRAGRAEVLAQRHHRGRRGEQLQPPAQVLARLRQRRAGLEAEDRAQDHLERDRLELLLQRERRAAGPARDPPLGL